MLIIQGFVVTFSLLNSFIHSIFYSPPFLKLQPFSPFSCLLPFHILIFNFLSLYIFHFLLIVAFLYIFEVFSFYYDHTIPAVVRAVDAIVGSWFLFYFCTVFTVIGS